APAAPGALRARRGGDEPAHRPGAAGVPRPRRGLRGHSRTERPRAPLPPRAAARARLRRRTGTLRRLRPGAALAVLRAAGRRRVLVLGRTPAAHRSHHRPLYATETVVNRLLAERAGLGGRVDLLVPAFVLDAAHGRTLLARSRARDAAIYGEWAALVLGLDREIAYLECRGLDWETPDRDRRRGLAAWRRRLDTP